MAERRKKFDQDFEGGRGPAGPGDEQAGPTETYGGAGY
jgi:hypothetical protein